MTDVEDDHFLDGTSGDPSRRLLLRGMVIGGLGLPALAACGGGDEAGAPGGTKVSVADVPVGGGTILAADELVVTQPRKGEFKAFGATCTHQGCLVTSIEDGDIVCPCHGSHFSIEDGTPTRGPATAPLEDKTVTVSGNQLSVG
jgi:Rieske Fe-S protein